MRFEFATATRIVFGEGAARDLPAAAAELGERPLLVTTPSARPPAIANPVSFPISGEPTVDLIRTGAALARDAHCDSVIAIGGGSAIDAGKALAAMLANPGDPLDYLEVIGRAQPLAYPSAPFIAVPTTAGTGAEVTRNAVLGSPEHRVKASMRSTGMLPRVALIDPELTLTLPRAATAATGLDALTQLIEPYVCTRANPMTDLYCQEGIRHAARALPKAFEDGADHDARKSMSWASLLGGLSLANAGLGAVHGFAAPLGGMFPISHGAAIAAVLPHAVEITIEALRARASKHPALDRYQTIARLLTGQPHSVAEDVPWWLAQLCEQLEIQPLSHYGVTEKDIPALITKAAKASSMKAHPIELTPEELTEILQRSL